MLRELQLQTKGEFTGLLRKHLEQELGAAQGMPALGDTHKGPPTSSSAPDSTGKGLQSPDSNSMAATEFIPLWDET